jgi:hypothetical protein
MDLPDCMPEVEKLGTLDINVSADTSQIRVR